MSYILDALTRSQRERREGEVPSLETAQLLAAPASAGSRRFLPVAVTTALVLLAILAARPWWQPETTAIDEPVAVTPPETVARAAKTPGDGDPASALAAPAQTPRSPIPQAPASPPQPASGPPTVPSQTTPEPDPPRLALDVAMNTTATPTPQPTLRQPPPATPIAEKKAEASAAPEPLPRRESLRTPERPKTRQAETKSPDPAIAAAPRESEPDLLRSLPLPVSEETQALVQELNTLARRAPTPSAFDAPAALDPPRARAPMPPPPSARAPEPPRTPESAVMQQASEGATRRAARASDEPARNLNALPDGVQRELGNLTVNAHVYADDPDERLVVINMRRYREGDRTREGAVVDTITARGAVMRYQSHRFHLGNR